MTSNRVSSLDLTKLRCAGYRFPRRSMKTGPFFAIWRCCWRVFAAAGCAEQLKPRSQRLLTAGKASYQSGRGTTRRTHRHHEPSSLAGNPKSRRGRRSLLLARSGAVSQRGARRRQERFQPNAKPHRQTTISRGDRSGVGRYGVLTPMIRQWLSRCIISRWSFSTDAQAAR